MSGTATNRTNITIPAVMASEILAKMQTESAVMQLAKEVKLPGAGLQVPVITADPEAAWVAETGMKPVSNPSLTTKLMTPYKLAVIVPFSNEFRRDASALYEELVRRLPRALAQKFDATVFGYGDAPGTYFDTFADCQAQTIGGKLYTIHHIDASEEHPYLAGFWIFDNIWVDGVIDFRNRRLRQYTLEDPGAVLTFARRENIRIERKHNDGRLRLRSVA